MKNRMLAEILALLGFFVILPSIPNPSAALLFILPGGGMIAAGAWLRNRSGSREVTGSGEETEAGSSAKEPKWPRWLVSVCAGLLVLRFLPELGHMPGKEEYNILLVFVILPSAAVMILSALGLFLVSFVIGLWILFILLGFGFVISSLVLAAPICIVPAILAIRALPGASAEKPSGRSPLYDAAQEGKWNVVQELVEHGADVNEEIGNESILEVAVENGNYEMVRFLVEHGAKIYHSSLGRNQIQRARHLKHDEIADFLQEELAKQ